MTGADPDPRTRDRVHFVARRDRFGSDWMRADTGRILPIHFRSDSMRAGSGHLLPIRS